MKEALSIIASAWSVAFIVLFVFYIPNITATTISGAVFFFLLGGAVTGAGWLAYRSDIRSRRE